MKQLIDYIPLLVFFSVWAMDERAISIAGFDHSIGGVFSAAEFLLAASLLVYGSLFIYQKRLDGGAMDNPSCCRPVLYSNNHF